MRSKKNNKRNIRRNSVSSTILVLLVFGFIFLFFLLPNRESGSWEEIALSNDAITGQAILTYQSCLDSDGGLNFEERGSVKVQYTYNEQVKKVNLSDECSDNVIKEYYCSGKRHRLREHPCSNICVDGACIS